VLAELYAEVARAITASMSCASAAAGGAGSATGCPARRVPPDGAGVPEVPPPPLPGETESPGGTGAATPRSPVLDTGVSGGRPEPDASLPDATGASPDDSLAGPSGEHARTAIIAKAAKACLAISPEIISAAESGCASSGNGGG